MDYEARLLQIRLMLNAISAQRREYDALEAGLIAEHNAIIAEQQKQAKARAEEAKAKEKEAKANDAKKGK